MLCSKPIEPLTLVRCYPTGMISMIDSGRNDEKIIAIPFKDPNYNMYTDIDQLPGHVFDEMKHFFSVYKTPENKTTAVNEVSNREAAEKVIRDSIGRYVENYCR